MATRSDGILSHQTNRSMMGNNDRCFGTRRWPSTSVNRSIIKVAHTVPHCRGIFFTRFDISLIAARHEYEHQNTSPTSEDMRTTSNYFFF